MSSSNPAGVGVPAPLSAWADVTDVTAAVGQEHRRVTSKFVGALDAPAADVAELGPRPQRPMTAARDVEVRCASTRLRSSRIVAGSVRW